MKLGCGRFNTYLVWALLLVGAAGCTSTGGHHKHKEASTLRLYLEADPDAGGSTATVPVIRANPVAVTIQTNPFLDETDLADAEVVDVMGGFAIQVTFDFHGRLILQNTTGANHGRRIVVFSVFGSVTGGRWLAAPMITKAISNGVLTFTPDATREEAQRVVDGLNNLAEKLGNRPKAK